MHRPRSLLIGAVATALTISAIAAPASAAAQTGAIAFVNGSPGRVVDVCVNGREVRSKLKYGQKATKTLAIGTKQLRFYTSGPGTCQGQVLGTKSIRLRAGQRQTAVITRKTPKKVVVFRNFEPVASPAAPTVIGTLRHAADVGAAYLAWELHNIVTQPADPFIPTVATPFIKGQSSVPLDLNAENPAVMILQAVKPISASPFTQPSIHRITLLREYEWILVGSTPKNARFIQLSYPLDLAP